ncbi:MAG: DnaJ C-terminal domain-containing protein, partial [Candidatus Micrarchaeota archaeon]
RNANFEDIFKEFGFNFGESGGSFSGGFGGDIFDFFGGGGGRRQNNDLRYDAQITLEQSAKGFEQEMTIPKNVPCSECRGTGAFSGKRITCSKCGGRGKVRTARRMGFAQFMTVANCEKCGGAGSVPEKACKKCEGTGSIRSNERITVKVPAGIEDGTYLRVSGQGNYEGGEAGDLYVVVHVAPHEFYKRDGDDLYCEVPISFGKAALGGEVEVPTLNGKAELSVPSGTQTHTLFRLRGQGMPKVRGRGSGDLIVRLIVQTPTELTQAQKDALKEFTSVEQKKKKGFFDSMFG